MWLSEQQVTANHLWRAQVTIALMLAVTFLMLVAVEFQIVRRNDSIQALEDSVDRIEVTVAEARDIAEEANEVTTDEAEFNAAIREAIAQIAVIRELVCQVDDPVRRQACQELGVWVP